MMVYQIFIKFWFSERITEHKILTKKVIILRKIHMKMKPFAPPFSAIERIRHIHASATDVLHTILE